MWWKRWITRAQKFGFFGGRHPGLWSVSRERNAPGGVSTLFVALLVMGVGIGGVLPFENRVRAATYSAYAVENGYFLSTPRTPAGEAYDTGQTGVEVDGWDYYINGGTQSAKIEVFNSTNNSFSTAGTGNIHYSVDMSNASGLPISGFSPVTATDERAIFIKVAPTTGLHMYVQAGETDILETSLVTTGPTLIAPTGSEQTTWNYTLAFTLMQEYQFTNANVDGSISQNEVIEADLSNLTTRNIDVEMDNYVYLIQRDSTGTQVGDQQLIWEGHGNEAADEFQVMTDPFMLDSALPEGNYYVLRAVWSNESGTSVSYFAATGVTLSVIPEPSTVGIWAGCGVVGVVWRIRRRS